MEDLNPVFFLTPPLHVTQAQGLCHYSERIILGSEPQSDHLTLHRLFQHIMEHELELRCPAACSSSHQTLCAYDYERQKLKPSEAEKNLCLLYPVCTNHPVITEKKKISSFRNSAYLNSHLPCCFLQKLQTNNYALDTSCLLKVGFFLILFFNIFFSVNKRGLIAHTNKIPHYTGSL